MSENKVFKWPERINMPVVLLGSWAALIIVGAVAWNNTQNDMKQLRTELDSTNRVVEVLQNVQGDLSDRTIRLEVVMDQVLEGIDEIKETLKKIE